MNDRKITALYDTRAEAEAAADRLRDSGLGAGDIDIHDKDGGGEGFLSKLKDFFGGHEDSHAYAEGVRRGHFLVTAKVDETKHDAACRLLEEAGAVDLEGRQAEWRAGGWTTETNTTAQGDESLRRDEDAGSRARASAGEPVLSSGPVIAEGVVVTSETSDDDAYESAERNQAELARGDPDPTAAGPESDRHSIAMDPTGERVQETAEEREARLRHKSPNP
jgi:hypothetical protein